jgi:hypothetical protein
VGGGLAVWRILRVWRDLLDWEGLSWGEALPSVKWRDVLNRVFFAPYCHRLLLLIL